MSWKTKIPLKISVFSAKMETSAFRMVMSRSESWFFRVTTTPEDFMTRFTTRFTTPITTAGTVTLILETPMPLTSPIITLITDIIIRTTAILTPMVTTMVMGKVIGEAEITAHPYRTIPTTDREIRFRVSILPADLPALEKKA